MSTEKPVVKYDSLEDFILVKALPITTLDGMMFEVDEVIRLSNLHKCHNLLVDATEIQSLPSNTDLYSFTKDLSLREETRNMKIRIATSFRLFVKIRFIETLAHKRDIRYK